MSRKQGKGKGVALCRLTKDYAWRWESQRKKIHRLAYRFSIDFKIYRLAYGFLCVNHKGLAKVYRFLVRTFFSQDFKIHRLVWIFLWIFGCYGSVSSMFHFDLEEKDKQKKFKLGLKYMYYYVHCTFVGMYISDF